MAHVCPFCGRSFGREGDLTRHKPNISLTCTKAQMMNTRPTATPTVANRHQDRVSNSSATLLTTLQHPRKNTPIIRRIPKAARQTMAESLTSIFDDCVRRNDNAAGATLLTFSYRTFRRPVEKSKESLTTIIKRNVTGPDPLPTPPTKPSRIKKKHVSNLVKGVQAKLQDGNISGTVRLLASEDTIAPDTADVLQNLQAKHPRPIEDPEFPDRPTNLASVVGDVSLEEVTAAINSFPNGSAGGIDGLRPQHFKDLVADAAAHYTTRLLGALTWLIRLMLNGEVPENICVVSYGASLTALKNKDGGIRPIAVGNTLRGLTGRVVSKRVMSQTGEKLLPHQLGYGTRGGAEAAIHATRAFIADADKTQVILKLDFKTAFNTVRRDKLLQAVADDLPEYYDFVSQMYWKPSTLLFCDHVIMSAAGVQQGDPLGPQLFCLITHKLCSSMESALNIWYLDDNTIGGPVESVERDLAEAGREIGLELNEEKCEAFVVGGDEESRNIAADAVRNCAPRVLFPARAELLMLGSPLLLEGIRVAIREKMATIRTLIERQRELPAHHALFLLKNFLPPPKVLYILRTCAAWSQPEVLVEFDNVIRGSLSNITNTLMSDKIWRQASLPAAMGGLGIRRTAEIALPA